MLSKLRPRSAYDVIALLALVVGLMGTGSAIAAIVISSNSQVAKGTISGHKPPSGKHANIIAGSINGNDIADNSGVETCTRPLVARYGRICAGSDGVERDAAAAAAYCAQHDLHLPSLSQAITLARAHDVPGVGEVGTSDYFWTDNRFASSGSLVQSIVSEDGDGFGEALSTPQRTVCVADPTA